MEITPFNILCNKHPRRPKIGQQRAESLTLRSDTDSAISSVNSKYKNNNPFYPYLSNDKVQMLSRVTERKIIHKKTTDYVSSFPLAVNIYKASSDQLKTVKSKRKAKKSVHTLPNDPAPLPHVCTVSDMNDSEYCEKTGITATKPKPKKRNPLTNSKKARVKEKSLAYYDHDDLYCSQMDIAMDDSTTNMLKHYNGDKNRRKSYDPNKMKSVNKNVKPQEVWEVLRNMNRFQFVQSPPVSVENLVSAQNKNQKRCPNRKDRRFIETRCTEEFAYISSYEVEDSNSHTLSQSSSCDRVTVIDKDYSNSKLDNTILNTNKCITNTSYNNKYQNKFKGKNAPKALKTVEYKGIGTKLQVKGQNLKVNRFPSCYSSDTGFLSDAENGQTSDTSDAFATTTYNIGSMHRNQNQSFIRSDNSGSSKAEFSRTTGKIIVKTTSKLKNSSINNSNKPNLKSENIYVNSLKTMKKTVASVVPKFTKVEIKKMLARYKFPIVFSDQVTPGIKVLNNAHPQFNGLDHHIWPFMVKWSDNKRFKKSLPSKMNNSTTYTKFSTLSSGLHLTKRQNNAEITTGKPKRSEEKKHLSHDLNATYKQNENKQQFVVRSTSPRRQQSHIPKPIDQQTDNTINLLYRKTSFRNLENQEETLENEPYDTKYTNELTTSIRNLQPENQGTRENQSNESKYTEQITTSCQNLQPETPETKYTEEYTSRQKADITTRIQLGLMALNNALKKRVTEVPEEAPNLKQNPNKPPPVRVRPWEKAKWTNDFIDNIFKKIKNGVYYTQDMIEGLGHKSRCNLNEIGIQAGPTYIKIGETDGHYDNFNPRIALRNNTETNMDSGIPGFSNALPALEIKTLNKNQITVKNCITNIMVQFDIAIPVNSFKVRANKQLSVVPLEVSGSNTQIYKCKTTIENAMLPAEICSILPKMMNSVIGFNVRGVSTKKDLVLSTISENTNTESTLALNRYFPCYIRPSIKIICEGTYPTFRNHLSPKINRLDMNYPIEFNPRSLWNLLDMALPLPPFGEESSCILELYPHIPEKTKARLSPLISEQCITSIPSCTTLDVYSVKNKRVALPFKRYDIVSIILNAARSKNIRIDFLFSSYIDISNLNRNVNVNVTVTNDTGTEKIIITVQNLDVQSIFKACQRTRVREVSSLKSIECFENAELNSEIKFTTARSKTKRRGYYKLYRKCKSTSNIPSQDKLANTPLKKVSNLEDFFQILGCNKMLTSIFDESASKKILTAVTEMKNWLTEISAQQAMLILLLTNKKDTPNLVRFRPILLQGIAVNRITKANELDMEIEVIEREQFHKFSQYHGISSPESVDNNLLEELCWIAKTTASDYQRPFDESSKKLLKSLLEKRKKLNPSYLRVMARYVGLGLLKSPTKRER